MGVQEREWFNEPRDRAGHSAENVKPQSGIDYFKLYLTIVAGIISAFVIMYVFAILFGWALINAFMHGMDTKLTTSLPPQQQNSSGFQRDLSNLAQRNAQQVSNQIAQSQLKRAQDAQKKANEASNAKKSDIQTCTFWREQYEKEKSDRNKMHANSACERAYGKLWSRIN